MARMEDERLEKLKKNEVNGSPNAIIEIHESNQPPANKQKGFETNLFFIKEYSIALCEFTLDNSKDNSSHRT
jgi:hypothetical protein